ncbi:MAG: 50S ribosomal protein L29 [Anaerolineae bacterium]
MKASEMRALTTEELEQELERLREETFNLRFQLATKQLSDYNRLTQVKRDIARAKTILRERELFGSEEEA